MNKNLIWVAVVAVIVLLVAAKVFHLKSALMGSSTPPSTQSSVTTSNVTSSASPSASVTKNVVNITATGFNPATITIAAGDSVVWMNTDSAPHNVNSDPHPTHTDYPPLNLGTIQPGDSKSLAFPTAGTYKYHDHLNPNLHGTVVVQ